MQFGFELRQLRHLSAASALKRTRLCRVFQLRHFNLGILALPLRYCIERSIHAPIYEGLISSMTLIDSNGHDPHDRTAQAGHELYFPGTWRLAGEGKFP
jgi:hypothetical protein